MTDAAARLSAALADRYRLERELGAGGMATVYLAEDLRHHRRVAIKVLRPELAAVLGADRFVQEITTTAQLQHPHILPLFDSGSAGGFLFYVMPYVEGETLRNKLDREKQLGVEEAVRITTEVADALDYAHRHGVIHRDIKPENILLHDGRPMVADFGIALAVSAAAGGRMTETGMSLGTPHYMSPEQATAEKNITGRSDIYSLASVLYEMLTGDPPHTGSSAQQIIMKIIAEPVAEVTTLRKTVPRHVAASVTRALEKLPADRFSSAREFADALLGRVPVSALPTRGGRRAGAAAPVTLARHPLVLGLGAALVVAVGFATMQWKAAHRNRAPDVVRFRVDMPATFLAKNGAVGTNMAVSPDGRTIAYARVGETGKPRLYIRRLDEETAVPLSQTDGAQAPCFSANGRWIAYLVDNVIWKVAVSGGAPVMVGSTEGSPVSLTWSRAGVMVVGGLPGGLLAMPANGGEGRILARPDSAAGQLYFNQPHALPDGRTALLAIQPVGGLIRSQLAIVSLETGRVTRLGINGLDPLAYADGTLVYVLPSGALMAVRVDLKSGRATGSPVALGPLVTTSITGASEAALSPSGTLVYLPPSASTELGWVDARGDFQPLLRDPQAYAYPRLSPDGRRFAMTIGAGGRSDVWVYDVAQGNAQRLTSSGTLNDRPEWTPDGRRVLFRTDRERRTAIWWQPADLSGPATPLEASDAHDFYEGVVSTDGRWLLYQQDDGGADQADVMYRGLEGDTAARPISATKSVEAQARLSPDGRWVAFVTDASGTSQVVVRPFPGPGGQVQVSDDGGSEPVWARDGRRLFYRDGRHMIAASVRTAPTFAVTGRTALFADDYVFARAPHANYDVSLDGTRFLMVKSTDQPSLNVVVGWLGELRARMRSAGAP